MNVVAQRQLSPGYAAVFVGALVVLVGCFLPAVESADAILPIRDNSVIQSDGGFLNLLPAVVCALLAYRSWSGDVRWLAITLVAGVTGVLVIAGIDGLTVEFDDGRVADATPGTGTYAVIVGYGLIALGGLLMRGAPSSLDEPSPPPTSPPEGWYADPDGGDELRWWDGSSWTGATKPGEDSRPRAGSVRQRPAGRGQQNA